MLHRRLALRLSFRDEVNAVATPIRTIRPAAQDQRMLAPPLQRDSGSMVVGKDNAAASELYPFDDSAVG